MVRLSTKFMVAVALAAPPSGCSLARPGADPAQVQGYGSRTVTAPGADSSRDDSLVVQIRGFDHSAAVSVLAWSVDDPDYGLRGDLSRNDGRLLGQPTSGHHELYVSPTLLQHMGGFRQAAVLPGPVLVPARSTRDVYACSYGEHCSPLVSTGVWLPDSVLRTRHDSLVVTFVPQMGEPWRLTLSAGLIGRYLHAIDSVSASLAHEGRRGQD
ncbi:MAG TPA: hypothetical protein VH277_07290 [Gemmatimonadaceae bacterium]|jgi:hypothetical protein|nr:hypothetical protein [Gemmatimonadaceae bacterium]